MYLINHLEGFSNVNQDSFFITDKIWGLNQFNHGIDETVIMKCLYVNLTRMNKNV